MPFTGSHPAAVLPLIRTPLVTSALVIGSMVPDVPLFGPVPVSYATTHSLMGVVTADVALGLTVYAVWHAVLVPPAVALAPRALRSRLRRLAPLFTGLSLDSARRLLLVALSVVIGAATHVGWDEFTHAGRWGPRHISALNGTYHGVAGWHWAQYVSGLIGVVVIAGYLMRWWRNAAPRPAPIAAHRVVSASCAVIILAATAVSATVAATRFLTAPDGANIHAAAYSAATRGGGAAAVAALVVALGWHLTRATRAVIGNRR